MSEPALLNLFDRFSVAPGGIERLRQLILDLAVSGQLDQQIGAEGSAEDEYAAIIEERRIQAVKAVKLIADDSNDGTLQSPPYWKVVRLGNIADFINGDRGKNYPSKSILVDKGVAFVNAGHLIDGKISYAQMNYVSQERYDLLGSGKFVAGDLLYCLRGSLGKTAIVGPGQMGAIASSLLIIRPTTLTDPQFLYTYLTSGIGRQMILRYDNGTAQPNLSAGNVKKYLLPLPPLAEQKRIVAKVEELMGLCDELEAAGAERERQRDRLNAASLHRIAHAPDDDALRAAARFHFRILPRVTVRPDQIPPLRQTILDLAVRGKLVEQHIEGETAGELVTKIVAEKQQLIELGKLKKEKPIPEVDLTHSPFPIPAQWKWVCLQEVFHVITDGDHQPPPKTDSGIPFAVIGNVRSQKVDLTNTRFVSQEYYEALDPIRKPQKGDLLYTLVGSFGIPVLVTSDEAFCVQRHIGILKPSPSVDCQFLFHLLGSRFVFSQAEECATGIAQKTVPLKGLRSLKIALPPLAEQRRIVAKVDELMALCDELEASLTRTQTESRRLLNAVMAEIS